MNKYFDVHNLDTNILLDKEIVFEPQNLPDGNWKEVEISSAELIKEIIITTGTRPRQKDAKALTRHITNELQFDLLEFDGIHYKPPNKNGGSSGRKMFFSKPKKDIKKT